MDCAMVDVASNNVEQRHIEMSSCVKSTTTIAEKVPFHTMNSFEWFMEFPRHLLPSAINKGWILIRGH